MQQFAHLFSKFRKFVYSAPYHDPESVIHCLKSFREASDKFDRSKIIIPFLYKDIGRLGQLSKQRHTEDSLLSKGLPSTPP
jgi:hypothetical protein